VGYSNAVYYSEDDIQTIADNFALINEYLVSMNINFKGIATIEDLEKFFDSDEFESGKNSFGFKDIAENRYILDKVNWDLGKNITSFTCRTVLFN
jgi:hypothetical protein